MNNVILYGSVASLGLQNTNPIRISILNDGAIEIPDNVELVKRCPIQLVEDGCDLWFTLLADIDFKNKMYKNIVLYDDFTHSATARNIMVRRWMQHSNEARFAHSDIIRNPTVNELQEILSRFKKYGMVFNKKKNKFVVVDKKAFGLDVYDSYYEGE